MSYDDYYDEYPLNPILEPKMINSKPENVKCPDCESPMKPRKNSKTGEFFWGCSKFPQCKGTRDNMGRSKMERELERGNEIIKETNGATFERASENDKYRFNKS